MSDRHRTESFGTLTRVKLLPISRCGECPSCRVRRRGRSLVTMCDRYKKAIRYPMSGPIPGFCRLKNAGINED